MRQRRPRTTQAPHGQTSRSKRHGHWRPKPTFLEGGLEATCGCRPAAGGHAPGLVPAEALAPWTLVLHAPVPGLRGSWTRGVLSPRAGLQEEPGPHGQPEPAARRLLGTACNKGRNHCKEHGLVFTCKKKAGNCFFEKAASGDQMSLMGTVTPEKETPPTPFLQGRPLVH